MYMSERLTIQDWTPSERPREKFLEKGAASLSDAEVLAILIRSGNRNDNAIDLARKILAEAGNNLQSLRKFSYKDYRKFKGIGAGKALFRNGGQYNCPHPQGPFPRGVLGAVPKQGEQASGEGEDLFGRSGCYSGRYPPHNKRGNREGMLPDNPCP